MCTENEVHQPTQYATKRLFRGILVFIPVIVTVIVTVIITVISKEIIKGSKAHHSQEKSNC